jgi:formylglycine-generating enzyme required for sulfatase activity
MSSYTKHPWILCVGGSWAFLPRTAKRSTWSDRRSASTRHNYVGFRLASREKN